MTRLIILSNYNSYELKIFCHIFLSISVRFLLFIVTIHNKEQSKICIEYERKNEVKRNKREKKGDCKICSYFKESQDTVSLFRWPFWPFYKHLLHKTLILVPCEFAQKLSSLPWRSFFLSLYFILIPMNLIEKKIWGCQ